jgi:hypothetical protein
MENEPLYEIPTRILRGYLDNIRLARKYAPGLSNRKIIVTTATPTAHIKMMRDALASQEKEPGGITLEVRS